MKANRLILLNLVWTGLVIGAFFVGRRSGDELPQSSQAGGSETEQSRSGANILGRSFQMGSTGGSGEDVTGLMQRLQEARAREEENLAAFVRTVTAENALAMLRVFEETPRDELTDRLFVEFLQAWGKVAGPEAITIAMDSYAKAKTGSRWRIGCDGDDANDLGVTSLVAGWASVDLAAVTAFTNGLHDEGKTWDSVWTHLGILRALESSDLDAAIAYSESHYSATLDFWSRSPYSAYPEEPFRGLVRVLEAVEEQRGLAGLEAWVAGINTDSPEMQSYRLEATSQMLEALREDSPERAAGWVAANAERGSIRPADIVRSATVFADTLEGQINWIATLPEGADRSAMTGPFRRWMREDFDAAGNWLSRQQLDPMYDGAIASFAGEAAAYESATARLWANEISDDSLRIQVLGQIAEEERTQVPEP